MSQSPVCSRCLPDLGSLRNIRFVLLWTLCEYPQISVLGPVQQMASNFTHWAQIESGTETELTTYKRAVWWIWAHCVILDLFYSQSSESVPRSSARTDRANVSYYYAVTPNCPFYMSPAKLLEFSADQNWYIDAISADQNWYIDHLFTEIVLSSKLHTYFHQLNCRWHFLERNVQIDT